MNNKREEYCRVLGLGGNASSEEIRQAYKRLVLEYHPEKNSSPDSGARFKEISEAHMNLCLGVKENHDWYHAWQREYYQDISFSHFPSQHSIGVFKVPCTLRDILYGKEVRIHLNNHNSYEVPKIHIKIPPGSIQSTLYFFNRSGLPVPTLRCAALIFQLSIEKHSEFTRDCDNLIYELQISDQELRNSSVLKIPTLEGTTVDLIPDGTLTSHTRVIQGYGLPKTYFYIFGLRGDLIVKINVESARPPMECSIMLTLEEFLTGCIKTMNIGVVVTLKNGEKMDENRNMEVSCKPGLSAGSVITLDVPFIEENIEDIEPSCVRFIIEQAPHPLFNRVGCDLEYTARINKTERDVFIEREVQVPTLEGDYVSVEVPEDATQETVQRIEGRGLPQDDDSNVRGDLLVKFLLIVQKEIEREEPMYFDVAVTYKELIKGCSKPMSFYKKIYDSIGNVREEEKTLIVVVSPGMRVGSKITFAEHGNEKPGTTPADVVFVIQLKFNKNFALQDYDIVHCVKLTKKAAKRCKTLDIPLPEGGTQSIKLRCLDSHVQTIAEAGFPFEDNPSQRGNLLVQIEISGSKKTVDLLNLFLTLEEILLGCEKTVRVAATLVNSKGRKRDVERDVNIRSKSELKIGQIITQTLANGSESEKIEPKQVSFIVKALPHAQFELDDANNNNDIVYNATFSGQESHIDILGLDEEHLVVKTPESPRKASTVRIPGRGMPSGSGQRGDLLVKFSFKDDPVQKPARRGKQQSPIEKDVFVTLEELLTGCTMVEEFDGRSFIVVVEPGALEGSQVIFTMLGPENLFVFRADIVFTIKTHPHKLFTRDGDDLIYRAMVTNEAAYCSAELIIPLLGGAEHILEVSFVNPEQKSEINGQGLPRSKDPSGLGLRGNLVVLFDICEPKNVPLKCDLGITLEDIFNGFKKIVPVKTVVLDENRRQRNEVRDIEVSSKPGCNCGATILRAIAADCVPNKFHFKINVLPHPLFKLKGVNLIYTAMYRAQDKSVTVPTLDCDEVTLDLPDEVSLDSYSKVLKGRGLPYIKKTLKWGDLIVMFEKAPDEEPSLEKKEESLLNGSIVEPPAEEQLEPAQKLQEPKQSKPAEEQEYFQVKVQTITLEVVLEDVLSTRKKIVTFNRKRLDSTVEVVNSEVQIDSATRDNDWKILYDHGDENENGPPNVMMVNIRMHPHKHFTRHGHDLHSTMTVSKTDRSLQIRMLDGGSFTVPYYGAKTRLEFSGLGLPCGDSKSKKRGKLVVKLVRQP